MAYGRVGETVCLSVWDRNLSWDDAGAPTEAKAAPGTQGGHEARGGLTTVKRLAADGAAVALTYSASPDKADEVVRAIEAADGRALAARADAGDVAALKAAVAKTVQAFGRLDILVNNAGVAIVKPVDDLSLDAVDRIVAVNVKGSFAATQEQAVPE